MEGEVVTAIASQCATRVQTDGPDQAIALAISLVYNRPMSAHLHPFSQSNLSRMNLGFQSSACRFSEIEQLPNEMMAKILEMLPRVTRSFAIALQTMQSLVCVSRKMYLTCNDLYITHYFLKACAEAYGDEMAEFAAQLKTAGARAWLEDYIQKNCLEDAYSAFQKLKLFALKLVRQAKARLLLREPRSSLLYQLLGPQDKPYSAACLVRTTRGFVLGISWEYLTINHLFGAIEIYAAEQSTSCNLQAAIVSIASTLIRYLNITFQGFATIHRESSTREHPSCVARGRVREVVVSRSSLGTKEVEKVTLREVDTQNLMSKRGCQNVMMHTNRCQHSFYALQCAFGNVLPPSEGEEGQSTKPFPKKLIKTLLYLLGEQKSEIPRSTT